MRELILEAAGFIKHDQFGPYEYWRRGCVVVLDAPMPPSVSNEAGSAISRIVCHEGEHHPSTCKGLDEVNEVFDRALTA